VKKIVPIAVVIILAGLWLYLLLRPGFHPSKPKAGLLGTPFHPSKPKAGLLGTPLPARSSPTSADRPRAPEFSLTALNGRNLTLSDYRGKVILLDFWATWCAPCQAEIPRFVAWQSQYGQRGLQVIGISMDDTAGPVRAFYGKFGINYPVALGNTKVAEDYGGILGLPVNFVIDRTGRIYSKRAGTTDLAVVENEIQSLLGR
jgi:peroxiredoxin